MHRAGPPSIYPWFTVTRSELDHIRWCWGFFSHHKRHTLITWRAYSLWCTETRRGDRETNKHAWTRGLYDDVVDARSSATGTAMP